MRYFVPVVLVFAGAIHLLPLAGVDVVALVLLVGAGAMQMWLPSAG